MTDDNIAPGIVSGSTVTFTPPTVKRGPGRPKGSGNRSPKSTAPKASDVDTALSTLEQLYASIALALTVTQYSATAEALANAIDGLQTNNRRALEASPKLASSIAKLGSASGTAVFISGNVLTLAPVFLIYRDERKEKRLSKTVKSTPTDIDESPSRPLE